METIEQSQLTKTYTYNDYKNLVTTLAEQKSCTGEPTTERIEATHLNAQRMKRIDKQCVLNPELVNVLKEINKPVTWLLITESWCGDGAQCIPVIAKMAEQNSNINLQLILRDENLTIMDKFLSNGARAVPKLIFIQDKLVKDVWGARPKRIQDMVLEYKRINPNASHDEFVTTLHLWYAKDKTQSIQIEFTELLRQFF